MPAHKKARKTAPKDSSKTSSKSWGSSWTLSIYHSKLFDIFARLKKVQPLVRIPNDPWPGDIQRGGRMLEQFSRFISSKITPDFWMQDAVQKDPYFTTFEWMRDLRTIGDNKSRRFVRYVIQSWIMYQYKMPRALLSPHLAGSRLNHALVMYEFYAQSADDRFLSILHKYLFRECVKLRWVAPRLLPGFDAVCALKGAIMASLAYDEGKRKTATLISRLNKVLSQILFSDGFNQDGRVDVQFHLACDLVEIRNFLRMCQDPGAAEKLQLVIEKVTPPLRLLRHGDGKLSFLSGIDVASTHHIDAMLSLSEVKGRSPQKSEHAGFERMLLKNHMILMKTKPSQFLAQSTGNLYFEWSVGKDRLFTAADVILETDKGKPLLSQHQALSNKYSEKDHTYLECELRDATYTHTRQLYLTEDIDLRGSDRITTSSLGFGALRFVVHPELKIEEHPSKKAVVLTNKKGERFTFTFSGVDGITTDYVQIFKTKHPVVFALFQLVPRQEIEIKWSLRGS